MLYRLAKRAVATAVMSTFVLNASAIFAPHKWQCHAPTSATQQVLCAVAGAGLSLARQALLGHK